MTHALVNQYLYRTDDELFEELGAKLLGDGLGIGSDNPEKFRTFGKNWFDGKRKEFQRQICNDTRVQSLIRSSNGDRLVEAVTLADLLSSIAGDTVHPALLAVLVTRVGLGVFCANVPSK